MGIRTLPDVNYHKVRFDVIMILAFSSRYASSIPKLMTKYLLCINSILAKSVLGMI